MNRVSRVCRRAWQWFQRASLWRRLALLLLPCLLAMTSMELWMTRHDALEAANSAYDRSLLGALKSIDANISVASGGLAVELPYTMFEFFELTASGQVVFRVATSDGLVELGSADLPESTVALSTGVPRFYDAMYFGEEFRFAAYRRTLNGLAVGGEGQSILVQVGESTRSRQDFTARFVRRAALRDVAILLFLVCGTSLALAAALRPLTRLAREVQARSADDLTPIDDAGLPADIRPLMVAVNQYMTRTQELVVQQRQFLDDASHQMRTHLTTLQMQVDYAQRETAPDRLAETLKAMGREIGRITRSTQQLLALGRSDTVALELGEVNLAALLRDVAVELLPMARFKHIDLGINPSMPVLMAVADEALLREALGNLVFNAIAYTPTRGTITVHASAREHSWRMTVEDDGPGLTIEECATLGHRFQRGQRAAKGGSGLGLAIARSIAERHGGGLELTPRASSSGLHAVIWWPRCACQGKSEEPV